MKLTEVNGLVFGSAPFVLIPESDGGTGQIAPSYRLHWLSDEELALAQAICHTLLERRKN